MLIIVGPGTAGLHVHQITLRTNLGNSITWPPNPDGADPFIGWSATGGTVLLGFCGQAGRVLDEIGVVTATFSPAHWSG